MALGSPAILALALCLAAALAQSPAAAGGSSAAAPEGREAELLARISDLEKGLRTVNEELAAHRQHSAKLRGTSPSELAEDAPAPKGPRFHDKVIAFFNACKAAAAEYVGPVLLSDSMFYLSILMVLQWHIRFHLGEFIHEKFCRGGRWSKRQVKPMMTLRRLGLNILILGIYYDKSLPGTLNELVENRPFFCSIGLVFVDTVVLFYSFMLLGSIVNPTSMDMTEWTDPLDEGEDDGICPDKFEANNIYEDLTIKFRRVCPIWLVQIMLVAFYIEELNSSKDTKQLENVDFIYWVVAVIFQMHGGDAQVGEGFNSKYWKRILNSKTAQELMASIKETVDETVDSFGADGGESPNTCPLLEKQDREWTKQVVAHAGSDASLTALLEDNSFQEKITLRSFKQLATFSHKVFWIFDMKFKYEWHIRRFMDFSVNSVARSIILYTVPIMVCVEGPLDFVKDLTAVMFITMLDNIDGDPKDITEILVKLKFGVEFAKDQLKSWELISQMMGNELVERQPDEIALNPLEKKFVEDNDEKFDRVRDLEPDKWKEFYDKGLPLPSRSHGGPQLPAEV